MVDETVQAAKTAAVLDAVRRIREVLPATPEELRDDRTAREVVTLNLFVAIQESLDLAQELGDAHGIAVCLETFAGLEATGGDAAQAATLFGASDAARSAIGAQRQPDNQILYERWLARTLARLDTKSYAKLYEDGRVLSAPEACELAATGLNAYDPR